MTTVRDDLSVYLYFFTFIYADLPLAVSMTTIRDDLYISLDSF